MNLDELMDDDLVYERDDIHDSVYFRNVDNFDDANIDGGDGGLGNDCGANLYDNSGDNRDNKLDSGYSSSSERLQEVESLPLGSLNMEPRSRCSHNCYN